MRSVRIVQTAVHPPHAWVQSANMHLAQSVGSLADSASASTDSNAAAPNCPPRFLDCLAAWWCCMVTPPRFRAGSNGVILSPDHQEVGLSAPFDWHKRVRAWIQDQTFEKEQTFQDKKLGPGTWGGRPMCPSAFAGSYRVAFCACCFFPWNKKN